MESVTKWANAVRLLSLLSALLLTVAIVEAWTLRRARAELQQLRTEREQTKSAIAAGWGRQSVDELRQAVQWLDGFYAEPERGLRRAGGLCSGGRLDSDAIVSGVSGFLAARAAGGSASASIETVRAAIVRTDEYRALHTDLARNPDEARPVDKR
jgi:hypothetical protein